MYVCYDNIYEISKWCDLKTLYNLSSTSKDIYQMFRHELFRSKVKRYSNFELASKYGHLDVIKFLYKNCNYIYINQFREPMCLAIINGHLKIVQWLYKHREKLNFCGSFDYSCEMDLSARNGHLETIQWCYTHNIGQFTDDSIIYAAEEGHLEVIQWLCTLPHLLNMNDIDLTIKCAAYNGHLKVVNWLRQNIRNYVSAETIEDIRKNPYDYYNTTLKWLL